MSEVGGRRVDTVEAVEVVEVALRDGLQNEATLLSTEAKVALGTALVDAGARRLEAVSFVHPRLVPAMADAEAVMAGLPRRPGVSYAGLVLNRRGLDRALAAHVDEVNVVVCASDTFSRRNQGMGRDEALAVASEVTEAARSAGLVVTLTVATAFGCPFEGEVDPGQVLAVAEGGLRAGATEVCLADTIGCAVPTQVVGLFTEVGRAAQRLGSVVPLRLHAHNTRNTGFANAWAALQSGVSVLDASVGGIGGCPFAPRATGNIGTDDLVYLLERSGYRTGFDLSALVRIADGVADRLGHVTPSLLPKAGMFPGS